MPEFQAVQCFKCRTFQVQQVSKAARGGNKFGCRMCSEKQSIRKVYAVGAAKDVRAVVVRLSSLQGEHTQASACAALNTNTPPFRSSWGGAPGADEAQGSEQHRGRSPPSGDCISYPPGSRPPARGAGSVNWGEFLDDDDNQGHQDRNGCEEASGNDGWDQGGAMYVTALPESNRKRPRRERSRQAAAAEDEGPRGPGGAEATGGAPTRDHQGWRSRSWTKPAPPPRFPVNDTARGIIGNVSGPPCFRGSAAHHSGARQQPQQSGREQQQHPGTPSAPIPSRAPCNPHHHQEHSRDRFGNVMGLPSASSSSSSAAAAAAASRPPVPRPSVQPRSLEPSTATRNAQQLQGSSHTAPSARQAAGSMGSRWDEFVDEEDEEEDVGRGGGGGVDSSGACQDGNSSNWGSQRRPAPTTGGRWGAAVGSSGGSCWGGSGTGIGTDAGGDFTTCLD